MTKSKQPEVREYKKTIVTIKWNGVKGTDFIISKDGLIVTNNHGYRGNNGNQVINHDGKVVGVVFATLQNPDIKTKKIIGAAIPASYIKTLLDEVKK
jgi:S1-C subfamily serine protease